MQPYAAPENKKNNNIKNIYRENIQILSDKDKNLSFELGTTAAPISTLPRQNQLTEHKCRPWLKTLNHTKNN